jgi:phage-related protein
MVDESPKPVVWISSSLKDLKQFPDGVRMTFGFALFLAQSGGKHVDAKPLKGFGGAGVIEVIEEDIGGTYRAVYTVRFSDAIYVLHCFQKKSKSGIATPKQDVELIKHRLRLAQQEHETWTKKNRP